MIDRRQLLTGLAAVITAPAIVRASSLMPIKAWVRPILDITPRLYFTINGETMSPAFIKVTDWAGKEVLNSPLVMNEGRFQSVEVAHSFSLAGATVHLTGVSGNCDIDICCARLPGEWHHPLAVDVDLLPNLSG